MRAWRPRVGVARRFSPVAQEPFWSLRDAARAREPSGSHETSAGKGVRGAPPHGSQTSRFLWSVLLLLRAAVGVSLRHAGPSTARSQSPASLIAPRVYPRGRGAFPRARIRPLASSAPFPHACPRGPFRAFPFQARLCAPSARTEHTSCQPNRSVDGRIESCSGARCRIAG